MSSSKYIWNFPSNNFGQITGIGDSGVETFKGSPIRSLAREVCQNSLDAKINDSEPVRVEFRLFTINSSEVPGRDYLEEVFHKSLDYWSAQKADKAKIFFKKAIKTIKGPKLTCLRISDFNTTGLLGSAEEYNSPWTNLTKSSGASDKVGSQGGSFGIGKFAPFACSDLRTVFYSTKDKDGEKASQGVARLTSFKKSDEDTAQGIGFYGEPSKNNPMKEQFFLDPSFNRKDAEFGTDINILGFSNEGHWKEEMVASVLEGFFYAIYEGSLVVNVDGEIIDKGRLSVLMKSYKKSLETKEAANYTSEYYQTLVDKNSRTFIKKLDTDPETSGKLTLKLLIKPNFHKRVAMIRQTGMKIKDKGNIGGLIPFAGVLVIEGDAINSYLRGLENPQHLDWEIGRAENKTKAKNLLLFLFRFVRDSLNEMKEEDDGEELDPAVGDFLLSEDSSQTSEVNRLEAISDDVNQIDITVVSPQAKQTEDGDREEVNLLDDEDGDKIESSSDKKTVHDEKKVERKERETKATDFDKEEEPTEGCKKQYLISALDVRLIVRNKNLGDYTIIFTPRQSAKDGVIKINMVAESDKYPAPLLEASCQSCPDVKIDSNSIKNLVFIQGKPIRLDVKLDFHDYCSLEVEAYGD